MPVEGQDALVLDRKSLLIGAAMAGAAIALVFALSRLDGPASRCAGAGGQMLVGPGGETACVNARTFLPLEGFDEGGKAN